MAKQVIILRHAKSSWSRANTADIDRALKTRGHNDARLIGNWLNTYCTGHRIGEITQLVSPANRTRLTADAINRRLEHVRIQQRIVDSLYLADVDQMLNLIRQQDDAADNLMLVGHNPGMHELVEHLLGIEMSKFPTCAIACLPVNIEHWQLIRPGLVQDYSLMRPRLLR